MRYFFAIVLPPLAVLACGKPFQAIGNIFLTATGWIPGVIHAVYVAHNHYADERARRLERAYNAAAAASMGYRYE